LEDVEETVAWEEVDVRADIFVGVGAERWRRRFGLSYCSEIMLVGRGMLGSYPR